MTQPSFVPAADAGSVPRSVPIVTPEVNRAKKPGLLGAPSVDRGVGRGTPGPDGGYALTLAKGLIHGLELGPHESPHDVEVGVALLAAKRAGLVGRAPSRPDVEVALDLFGFRGRVGGAVLQDRRRRFAGLGNSYAMQRSFVDAVPDDALRQIPSRVTVLVLFAPHTALNADS